jgi:hypothetical protein
LVDRDWTADGWSSKAHGLADVIFIVIRVVLVITATAHRHIVPGLTLTLYSACALGIFVTFLFLLPYRYIGANQASISASALLAWACFCTILLHIRNQPEVRVFPS